MTGLLCRGVMDYTSNLLKLILEFRSRRRLVKSAQLKVAQDGCAKRVTAEEWNALARPYLRKAVRAAVAMNLVDSK